MAIENAANDKKDCVDVQRVLSNVDKVLQNLLMNRKYKPRLNKKKLHKIRQAISEFLKLYGLRLKNNWQVFKYGVKVKTRKGANASQGFSTFAATVFIALTLYFAKRLPNA